MVSQCPLLACHALQFLLHYNKIDPSVVLSAFDRDQLSKIHQHSWKEHLKISENAKFEGYLLKTEAYLYTKCIILFQCWGFLENQSRFSS